MFSGGKCNLDGALGDWQEEVLDCLLYSWLDTLLQLRVLLEEEDLGGEGEEEKVSRGNRGFALLESHTPMIKMTTEILGIFVEPQHQMPCLSTFTSILLFC